MTETEKLDEVRERLCIVLDEYASGLSFDAALTVAYRQPKYLNRDALAADLRTLLNALTAWNTRPAPAPALDREGVARKAEELILAGLFDHPHKKVHGVMLSTVHLVAADIADAILAMVGGGVPAELAELSAKATPGEWIAENGGGRGSWIGNTSAAKDWAAMSCGNSDQEAEANAAFIVAAVNYVRSLASQEG